MKAEELRNLLRAQPFQPFVIHLPEGRQVRIAHHDFARLSPNGRTPVAYDADESFNVIDVLLIASIEVGPPPAVPNEQGSGQPTSA
jgi:hypothetical protein